VQLIIQAVAAAIEGDWRKFGELLRDAWDVVWAAIITSLRNSATILFDLVGTIITSIKSFFADTDWGAVGLSIIQGIARGVTGGLSLIANAAKDAARSAYDAAMGFLKSDSPSKLFEYVGGTIPQGMARGILGDMQLPTAAARDMALATYASTPSAPQQVNNTPHIYIERLTLSDVRNAPDLLRQLQEMAI
jgi:phage-related protein